MSLDKFCVFCGAKPSQRSREHIVPRWLLKRTGDPNRKAYFGRNWLSPKLEVRQYAWSAFTFPACDDCNHKWAALESNVQGVVERLLRGELASSADLRLLLDWFDKVRTGIWLGMIYLNKNYRGLIPQFYIDGRVAQKDRFLLILESTERENGIALSGCDTPIFHKMPSAFHFVINHLHFVSVSADFILAKRFGWPYVVDRRLIDIDTAGFEARFTVGTGKIESPVLLDTPALEHRLLLQPIALQITNDQSSNECRNYYHNDHIRSTSMDANMAIGCIFVGNTEPAVYPEAPSDLWKPRRCYSKCYLFRHLDVWVAQLQRHLFLDTPDFSHFPENDRNTRQAEIDGVITIQDRIIEYFVDGGA